MSCWHGSHGCGHWHGGGYGYGYGPRARDDDFDWPLRRPFSPAGREGAAEELAARLEALRDEVRRVEDECGRMGRPGRARGSEI